MASEFDYGVQLIQALLALLAVCVLAWVVFRWSARRGLGSLTRGRRIEVLERVYLDARRSLYLVKMGTRVLLIGAGDGGSPSLIAELSATDLPTVDEGKPPMRFADVLRGFKPRS